MRNLFLNKTFFTLAFIFNLCFTYAQYGNYKRYESVAQIVANKVLVDYNEEYKFMFRGQYLTVFYNNDRNTEIFKLNYIEKGELKYKSTSNNGIASVYSNWNNDGYGNIYYETPVSINVNSDNIWFNGTANIGKLQTERQNNKIKEKDDVENYSNTNNNSSTSDDKTKIWKYFDNGHTAIAHIYSKEGVVLELGYSTGGQSDEPLYLIISSAFSKRRIRWQKDANASFKFDNEGIEYQIINEISSEEYDSEGTDLMYLSSFKSSYNPEEKIELIEILELFKKKNSVTFNITTTNSDIKSFIFSLNGSSKAINSTVPFHSEMLEQIKIQKAEAKKVKDDKPWWKFWD